MRGFSFLADEELYTVDVTLVRQVVRNITFTPLSGVADEIAGIANINGGIVTILNLAELLGLKRGSRAVHAVIFKPFTDGNDQMGLLIDEPGDLIDINENEILPPPLTAGEWKKSCISGMIDVDGRLYRIIDIDSIIKRFIEGAANTTDIILPGGVYNEE